MTSVQTKVEGFFVAAFALDGTLEGIGRWSFEELSDKWLTLCDEYLAVHTSSFDELWSGNLAHIRTRLTRSSGVALVTFSAHGRVGVSIALASGARTAASSSVLKMFVNSLRNVTAVRSSTQSPEPFQQVLTVEERPVMMVVPWADPEISDQDDALMRELSIHLAAAFFRREV